MQSKFVYTMKWWLMLLIAFPAIAYLTLPFIDIKQASNAVIQLFAWSSAIAAVGYLIVCIKEDWRKVGEIIRETLK